MPIWDYATMRKSEFVFDKFLELRDRNATAIAVASSPFSDAALDTGFRIIKDLGYRVIVQHAAYTGYVAGTAFWTVNIEASPNGTSGWVVVGTVRLIGTSAATRLVSLHSVVVNDLVPNAKALRTTAVVTGTPGALSYGAFIAPNEE